ncbi:MAG TPA: LLM class flavin-dependent oxidoreductase [Dehalococcoidia bacterium]|nr:LLM class flavin-dependent oxidoreductase [Dehalococcoidia bacterium]
MKVSVFSLMQRPGDRSDAEAIGAELDTLSMAEDLGYYGAYVAEHHFSPYCLGASPPVLLGYLAAKTRRIRLGMAVSVLPLNNPIKIAEDYATVDVLSGGRLELGVGRGYNLFEFGSFGVDIAENSERFFEVLEAVRLAWTEDRFSYRGRHYCIENTEVLPKPIQKPHPPVFYANISPGSVEKAAQAGLGICILAGVPPDQIIERRSAWIDAARAAGYDEAFIQHTLDTTPQQKIVWVDEDNGRAREYAAKLISDYGESLEKYAFPGTAYPYRPPGMPQYEMQGPSTRTTSMWSLEAMEATQGAFVGSPEVVTEKLLAYREKAPLEYMLMWCTLGGPDRESLQRCVRLFGEKVLPKLA